MTLYENEHLLHLKNENFCKIQSHFAKKLKIKVAISGLTWSYIEKFSKIKLKIFQNLEANDQ